MPTRLPVPKPAAKRLSLYLRECERFQEDGVACVSSEELGSCLGISAAQVRRDLSCVAQAGQRGVGYEVPVLLETLQREFGLAREWRAVLVGVGNIGRALLGYGPFRSSTISIVAAFDRDPSVIGSTWGGRTVMPLDALAHVVQSERVELGVIAVPTSAAQEVADRLVAAGVRGILNFAPVRIVVPSGISASSVDFAVELRRIAMDVVLGASGSTGVGEGTK